MPQLPKSLPVKPALTIGCSAFDNWQWKGIFYPEDLPRAEYFAYYCQYFSTFEINATFYKFPSAKTLSKWYRESPADFVFSVKAPKDITHVAKFENCEALIPKFYTACEALKEKLGCVLFQFPASFRFDAGKLELIVKTLDQNYKNVVEFRHESWWNEQVFEVLRQAGITFCNVSYPGLPESFPPGNLRYIRLHGEPDLFYSEYSQQYLRDLHKSIIDANAGQTYIYLNNTASPAGIKNAMFLSEIADSFTGFAVRRVDGL